MYVAYGYLTENGYTWMWSFISRIDDTFGGSEFEGVRQYNRILGVAYQTGMFVIVLLVLLNVFIAILNSAYNEASEAIGDAHWARHQFTLVNDFEILGDTYAKIWDFISTDLLGNKKRRKYARIQTEVKEEDEDEHDAAFREKERSPLTPSGTAILAKGIGKSRRNLFEDSNANARQPSEGRRSFILAQKKTSHVD
jgi:hypothetical protein